MLYAPRGQRALDCAPGTLSRRACERRRLAQIERTGRHTLRIEATRLRYAVELAAISTTQKETLAAGAQEG
jgi:CHAD domain-containing protein